MLGIKHSGQLGDIIYSLSFVRAYMSHHKFMKMVLFIPSDRKSNYAKGITHISGDLMFTRAMFEFIRPLLLAQSFIYDVIYIPEANIPDGILNLDSIRDGSINMSAGDLRNGYFKYFGMIDDSNNEKWLDNQTSKEEDIYDILIGRSTRYLNLAINYESLIDTNLKIGFIGTDFEYQKFSENHKNLKINRVEVDNALDAFNKILNCKLFIGNQSLFFAMAEAAKHPRLLEVFEPIPNVVPSSGCSGSFITTLGLMNMLSRFFPDLKIKERYANLNQGYILSL